MNIQLHIERLVLDGLPLERGQGPALQAAVEAELARLLTENGLAESLAQGGAMRSLRGGDIQLAAGGSPTEMGTRIAGAVYGGIGGGR